MYGNPNKLRNRKPVPAILGLLFVGVFGYFGVAVVSSQAAQTRVAKIFRPVQAVVLLSEVGSFNPGNPRSSTSYSAMIEYRYEVDGHEYRSRRYAYMSSGFKNYEEAQKVVEKYPVGGECTVYYDPDDPENAVVNRGKPGLPAVVMGFPFVLFALVGLIMTIYGIRGTTASGK